jgi:lipopolysaccharide transport system permease protein
MDTTPVFGTKGLPGVSRHARGLAFREPSLFPSQPRLTVRHPGGGWRFVNIAELWQYRELLYFLTWRDVKVRYTQTVLGIGWAILQPVMMMIVFTVFFGRMAKVPMGNIPYPIFAFSGLLPWTFFATAIANAGNSVVAAERLITKIYFPRLAVPLAAIGAAIVDFCIAFAVLMLMAEWYVLKGAPIHLRASFLLVPAIFSLIGFAAIGVGTLLAALNVNYRDFRYVIPFLVQLWMFATPTVYMQAFAGPGLLGRLALLINPLSGLIGAFRAATLGSPIPWNHLIVSSVMVVIVLIVGCLYFCRVECSFADTI